MIFVDAACDVCGKAIRYCPLMLRRCAECKKAGKKPGHVHDWRYSPGVRRCKCGAEEPW